MAIFAFRESEYVSEAGLQNLKLYKYSAIDKSPIANYVLKPYWNWAVELFPLWMAPNLITLFGLGFIIINVLCIMYWIDDLVGPGPRWLYLTFSAGMWLYSTFDNVDGKQARRTGTSSPLGELFDHGCDALQCSFSTIVLAAALGLGHTGYSAVILLLTTVPFYLTTWEEYNTGTLYLGYFNGPTEGVIIVCILMIISGIKGPELWLINLNNLFYDVPTFIPASFTLADLLIIVTSFVVFVLHIPASLYNVYVDCKHKKKSFLSALSQLFAITLYSLCGYLWLASPDSYILKNKHFILYALTVGIVFGRVATKIILAHVTKMAFPMYTVLLIPLFVGAVLTNIPRLFNTEPILTANGEYYYLLAYFAFSTVSYFHWAILVIKKFCEFLNISCFRIPVKKIN